MESHASAASAGPQARGSLSVRAAARRLYTSADPAISLAVATALATSAFVANGGLQLGRSTAVEVGAIAIGAVLVGAAIVAIGFEARLHGGVALAAVTALGGLTALSILWSLYPSDSWIEQPDPGGVSWTNRCSSSARTSKSTANPSCSA